MENREEKKIEKKKKRRNYFLPNFIVAMIILGGLVYLAGTETFEVKTITTKGNAHYTTGEIVALGAIEPRHNIFTFPSKKVKEELLKDPYIKDAVISRKLPDKIIITVEERLESASVEYGDKFVIIDREGIILRISDERPGVTLVRGITLTNIKAGTMLDAEEQGLLQGSLQLLAVMDDHDLFFREIKIMEAGIRAYVYDELYCEGMPDNILKSMDDLKDVLYDLYVKGIERGIVKVGGSGYISYSAVIE